MRRDIRRYFLAALGVCAQNALAPGALAGPHDVLIAKHAAANGVPEQLVRRVIRIESRGNPSVVSAGNYGLMQIRLGTARSVGYHGDAAGLLDADTNMTYAVKYLAGAYRAAGCSEDRAVSYYQHGYYGSSRRECSAELRAENALAEVKLAGKIKRESTSAKAANASATEPTDVIKPKVVRTETIATPKSKPPPARPVGAFEPKRVAPPPMPAAPVMPARPIEEAKAMPANPTPVTSTSTAKADLLKPAAVPTELASVPLPPERPDLQAARQEEPERHAKRSHHTGRRVAVAADDPGVVATFLKKLVGPEKKQRRRRAAKSDPDGLARIPPPL